MKHAKRTAALLLALLVGALSLGGCAAPADRADQADLSPSPSPAADIQAPTDAPEAAPEAAPEGDAAEGFSTQDVQTLLDAGVFSGEMAPLEAEVIPLLYGLDDSAVTDCAAYLAANTAQSADEVAVLVLADDQAAQEAQEACLQRVADQLKTCRDYAPAAVPSLEAAVVERRGNTVLLAVGDPETLPQAVAALRG